MRGWQKSKFYPQPDANESALAPTSGKRKPAHPAGWSGCSAGAPPRVARADTQRSLSPRGNLHMEVRIMPERDEKWCGRLDLKAHFQRSDSGMPDCRLGTGGRRSLGGSTGEDGAHRGRQAWSLRALSRPHRDLCVGVSWSHKGKRAGQEVGTRLAPGRDRGRSRGGPGGHRAGLPLTGQR